MKNILIFLSTYSLNDNLDCLRSVVGSDYLGRTLTASTNVSDLVYSKAKLNK